jgi:hypothetical protein
MGSSRLGIEVIPDGENVISVDDDFPILFEYERLPEAEFL